MYLEIEIEKDRGREKKYVTLKLEEDTHKIKMKFDRKPDFEVPDFIMLGKRRSRAKRKVSSGSKGLLRRLFCVGEERLLEQCVGSRMHLRKLCWRRRIVGAVVVVHLRKFVL